MPIDPTKLRQLRQERGLTQQALASAASTSIQRISEIERGQRIDRIELSTVERLASALQVDLPTLLRP